MSKLKLNYYRYERNFKIMVETKQFWNLMMSYGHDTLLELMKEYEESENFEDCDMILKTILKHNLLVNDDLKTKCS